MNNNKDELDVEVMYRALTELNISSDFILITGNINTLQLMSDDIKPDYDAIKNKFNEIKEIVYLENNFKILRKKRNELLKECDYLAIPDYPHKNPEIRTAWKIYRQQLRDLPSNNESIKDMKLDEYDELIGVVWPTPPS